MSSGSPVNNKVQDGIALIVFVIVLAFAAIAYALSNISIEKVRYEEVRTTQSVLKRAKQALLDSALTYADSNPGEFGFLPCPDYFDSVIPDEGGSDGNCGAAGENILGLFPWASLETGILKSGTGECLWYAVSGEYKGIPKTAMLNEDSNGAMRLYHSNGAAIKQGALAEDRVIAIIFDPSNVLHGQNRSFDNTSLCGKDYFPSEYLEGDGTIDNSLLSGVAFAIDDFIARGAGTDKLATPFTPYNDQLITISRNELWDAVVSRQDFVTNADSTIQRHTRALAMCIAAYGNNSGNRKLPRPVNVDFSGLDYRIDTNYDDTAAVSYLGRYPYTVDDSDTALSAAYAPNIGESDLFSKGFCNALAVAGGPVIDLEKPVSGPVPEGYTTWKNWKDHFFYAVSSYYAPVNAADTVVPSCDGTNCIVVGGIEYAAVVLYAGSRTGAQVRNEPVAGDADTKNSIANYIEVSNPVGDGTGDYTPTGNDIAYCITDTNPLTVVSCP